jgi:hypothetical protein
MSTGLRAINTWSGPSVSLDLYANIHFVDTGSNRHINIAQLTINRNYQSFRYGKNSDTEDRSLFQNKSYFEEDGKFEQDIQDAKTVANRGTKVCPAAPFISEPISAQKDEGCFLLKVNLNKKKLKAVGLVVSSVINIKCRYTLIAMITDLAKGEE